MEQTVAERPLSQVEQISQLRTWHNGPQNSSDAYSQHDQSRRWYPRRLTDWNRTNMDSGGFGNGYQRQDTDQIPVCRDNLRGKCARGASCKYRHSESGEHVGSTFYWNEQQNLGTVANLGSSQFHGANTDNDSRTRSLSREFRNRSPCHRFQSGRCNRGASCPYLHPEFTKHDRPTCDWSAEQQPVVAPVRNPCFGEENMNSTLRGSQGHHEANKENELRTMSFSREPRSRSPCRNFLSGKCHRGSFCRRWHPVNTYVRSRHDLNSQQHQGVAETPNNPCFGDGSLDFSLRTSREHDEAYKNSDLRTGSFSRERRSRSPCQNFLRGKCHRGASCVRLHPVTVYDRTRYSYWSAQQHQGVGATSRNQHFGEENVDVNLRLSQEHDKVKSHGVQLSQDLQAPYEHDNALLMKDAKQLACNTEKMEVTSRSWSSERQRSRLVSDFGCRKIIREVCLKFTKGRCTRGESCKYLHGYHEYASSVSNCSKKSHLEAAEDSRNFRVENRYSPKIMARDHDNVKNDNMQLSGHKHTDSHLVYTEGSFGEETKWQSVIDIVKPEMFDQKVEATGVDGHKCETSGDKIVSYCSSAEGSKDISLWSRPFKRRRSRSRSPFTPKDDFYHRKLRREDSHIDFHRGRCYTVARFQYPDRRSYKYDRLKYHMDNQQHSNVAANTAKPCSRENGDFFLAPQSQDVVVSQGMQLDQCSNVSLHSDSAILSKKNGPESPACTLQPSHLDQNAEELVRDSSTVDISVGPNAIKQEVVESDSTNSCEEHHFSQDASNMTVLEKDGNAEVTINVNHDGNEKTAEMMQAMKTFSRKNERRRHPSSSKSFVEVEPMEEEVIDASALGLPVSSVGGTSLSNLNVVTVSGISSDLKMTASVNDVLENVLTNDHSAKQQENGALTNEIQNNVESALVTAEDGCLLVGNTVSHSLQASQSSSKAAIPNSGRKLLVLDVNGLLADIVAEFPDRYKPDTMVSGKGVFKRPFCDEFLQFCFEKFDVGIWSSRTKKNVDRVVDFLMRNTKKRLIFCWDQSHCTKTGYTTIENKEKPLVLKELKNLWENRERDLPWDPGFYNETNTVLLDDSPYKALRNPPFTAIFPFPYSFRDVEDKTLGPGGDLRIYLERLAEAQNVQKFIQENPFGQRPITKSNLSWAFYSKIVGTYDSQQEGDTNTTPDS